MGFRFATISGTTVSIADIVIPAKKYELIAKADKAVDQVNELYRTGLFSDDEQYTKTIDIWTKTGEEVTQALLAGQNRLNPILMMATSGARGSIAQVKQIAGMRGLMADPSGRILSIPIKANLKEGLTVLEYFISTHGARKGLADTALRTADSGYLTRRLVDVAQDVIVREEDCKSVRGIIVRDIASGKEIIEGLFYRINGRFAIDDIPESGASGQVPRAFGRRDRRRNRASHRRRGREGSQDPVGAHVRRHRRRLRGVLRPQPGHRRQGGHR